MRSRRPPPPLVALPDAGPPLSPAERVRAYLHASSPEEVRLHLELLDRAPGASRTALLALIRAGAFSSADEDRLYAAFGRLGWSGVGRALERVVGDRDLPREAREMALRLLSARDIERGRHPAIEEGLSLAAELVGGVVAAGDGGRGLVDFLELSPDEVRGPTVTLLEEVRQAERIPASLVWGAAAGVEWIACDHPVVLGALSEEGSPEAEEVLDAARKVASPRLRPLVESALLRLRTARIEPEPTEEVPDVRARVSAGDGSGAFQVLVGFPTRPGMSTVLGVCVRAGGDVRDGGLFPNVADEDRELFLGEFSARAGVPAVDVPLAVAVALVEAGVERTARLGRTLPPDTVPAIRILSSLTRERSVPDLPACGEAPSLARVRALLRADAYASWRFDAADLRMFGVTRVPPERPTTRLRAWARAVAPAVVGTPVADRLAATCRHQAWWLAVVGDPSASIFARLALDLDAGAPDHPLVVAILERSAGALDEEPLRLDFGDSVLRTILRGMLPGVPDRPLGRDVARLDIAEIAVGAVEQALGHVDVSRRPRSDEILSLSVGLAGAAVALVGAGHDLRDVLPWLTGRFVDEGLSIDEASASAVTTVDGLALFRDSVCADCPEDCWARLGRSMARVFRAPGHPSRPG